MEALYGWVPIWKDHGTFLYCSVLKWHRVRKEKQDRALHYAHVGIKICENFKRKETIDEK